MALKRWPAALVGFFVLWLAAGCSAREAREERVHQPGRPGFWFPNDAKQLRADVDKYLAAAPEAKFDQPVVAIVSPHAGLALSGWTAARAYKCLTPRSDQIRRVIILAFSHGHPIRHASVLDVDAYQTPLGKIPTDRPVIQALLKDEHFRCVEAAHRAEHSDENQLPFLQTVLKDFKVVAIYVGDADEAALTAMADAIRKHVDEKTVLVVSSDFTHYGRSYGYTPFTTDVKKKMHALDRQALERLAAVDYAGFREHLTRQRATICGRQPLSLLLKILTPENEGRILHYETSADRTDGDYSLAVGYAALAFTGKLDAPPATPATPKAADKPVGALTAAEKDTLVKLAHATLKSTLEAGRFRAPDLAAFELTPALKKNEAAFLTLTKGETKRLRGCIGSIIAVRPLYADVIHHAYNAGFRDTRFSPLSKTELGQLQVHVTVLTAPEPISSVQDIVIGKHGLILEKGRSRGLFLPQVPVEQKWNLLQYLEQLCGKAGLPKDAWKDKDAKIEWFYAKESFGDDE